jgi:hypothetical protein
MRRGDRSGRGRWFVTTSGPELACGRAGSRDARAFLESHGIGGRLATRLALWFGGDTEARMRQDPCAGRPGSRACV